MSSEGLHNVCLGSHGRNETTLSSVFGALIIVLRKARSRVRIRSGSVEASQSYNCDRCAVCSVSILLVLDQLCDGFVHEQFRVA